MFNEVVKFVCEKDYIIELFSYNVQIAITGNPFVDTGLAVLSYLCGKKSINELTLDDIKSVHNDGKLLSIWNSKLKSTSMILTLNSLITNPSIKPVENRLNYYSKITTAICEKFNDNDINELCECCGNESSIDIDNLIRKTLVPLGYNDKERYIGRDWFPLAGSLRSDAQALPAASRPPNICAKCLFAIHYLPLGVILVDGRLTLFQSTSIEFWYELVSNIAKNMRERLATGHYETLGSKEGSTMAIRRLLEVMSTMKEDVDKGTSLFMWRFSNSGTGPDCKIDEIPNNALVFLHTAVQYGLKNEIMDIISNDRRSKFSFFKCISLGYDYNFLYPHKNYNGVSQKLFFLYQRIIRGISTKDLSIAFRISENLKTMISPKQFDKVGKDLEHNLKNKNAIKKSIVKMVEKGVVSFQDYYSLLVDSRNEINYSEGWSIIKYYMHNLDQEFFNDETAMPLMINYKVIDQNKDEYMENIIHAGRTIYQNYIDEKGIDKFRKFVLENFTKNINPRWLRNQFVKIAERDKNFTYDYWKHLAIGKDGRDNTYNLIYLLRLVWTELIRQRVTDYNDSDLNSRAFQNVILDTDISINEQEIIKDMALSYIQKFGIKRFKEVLKDLRNGTKSLYWIRKSLSDLDNNFKNDETWNSFLSDSEGNIIKYLRLFQIQLILENTLRENIIN